MASRIVGIGRRWFTGWIGISLLNPVQASAALPPGIEGRPVHIQLDGGALQLIPGDERADARVTRDLSPAAETLIKATPPGRGVPMIYLVIGVLSIPVIWDTIREMLRRDYYGGVLIDARSTPAKISNDRALKADTITFIGPDGKVQNFTSRTVPEDVLLQITKAR